MRKYPYLNDATPVLDIMKAYPEFTITYHPNTNLASLCYNVINRKVFNNDLCREIRGMLINTDTNEIILRPFHKFFNVGETDELPFADLAKLYPDVKGGYRIEHKVDGSMVLMSIYQNELIVASKRSIKKDPIYNGAESIVRSIKDYYGNITVIFERVYKSLDKTHQHLLEYGDDYLVLLAIRDNNTGEYKSITNWLEKTHTHLETEYGFIRLNKYDHYTTYEDLLKDINQRTDFEGWVLHIDNEMYKIKTDWYIRQHSLVSHLCERTIANLVLAEEFDDARSYLDRRFSGNPILQKIDGIAEKVMVDYSAWLAKIEENFIKYQSVEMRDVVKILDKKDAHLLNQRRKGWDVDWKAIFLKEFKQTYSIVCLD